MKKIVFLFGVMDKFVGRTGSPISNADFDMIDRVATAVDVSALIVHAIPDMGFAGRHGDVTMGVIRQHRQRTLNNIMEIKPDVVVACGPIPLKCLMDKGNVVLNDNLRLDLTVPDLPNIMCVASHSLEYISANPGVEKHLLLDVYAALHGRIKTKWGKYAILQPGTDAWDVMPEELKAARVVGLDLETFPGLSPWHPNARIRMAVVSDKVGRAWLVQAKPDSSFPTWLINLASDPAVLCGGSNIKFDYRWMNRFGYTIKNMHDTSVAEHVLDNTNPLTDLKSLTFQYCPKLGDYSRGHRQLVTERGGWEYVHDNEMYNYTGGDGESSVAATLGQLKKLKAEGLLRPFNLSMGLYQVLADMEVRGACVSAQVHTELAGSFTSALAEQSAKIMDVFGPVNLNSPDQIAEALMRAVPGICLTKPKLVRQMREREYLLHKKEDPDQYSTDKAVLERESHKHPVLADLLMYRRLSKLHGTYIVGLHDKHMVSHPDGNTYIYTSYRADKTGTYRLSSQGPNLQNIPRKPEPDDPHPIPLHLNIKTQFVSRWPGGSIIEADAGQAEIRVAAHISRDEALLAALTSGLDVHTAMCAQFHNKPVDQVTKLERTYGKRQTFLVLYGGGANTLSQQLGIPITQAKAMLDQFFRTYPGLAEYIAKTKLEVKRTLYSESMFGYRRRFRKPYEWNGPEGWHVERKAWNHKVQNGAACLTFIAMMDLEKMLRENLCASQIVMQVHDSIVVDCCPGEEKLVMAMMTRALEHPRLDKWGVSLICPLVADVEIGSSWGNKEKYVDAV